MRTRGVPPVPQSEIISRLTLELAAKQITVDTLLLGFQSPPFPIVSGLSFDVLYKPAATMERLGGDWYDIFSLPDGRTAFTIGDVCGRGLAAAVKMGQAKQAVKVAASLQINDPCHSLSSSKQIKSFFSTTIRSRLRRRSTVSSIPRRGRLPMLVRGIIRLF
jgi:hypothetical protein